MSTLWSVVSNSIAGEADQLLQQLTNEIVLLSMLVTDFKVCKQSLFIPKATYESMITVKHWLHFNHNECINLQNL